MLSGLRHDIQVECQIVLAGYLGCQHLPGDKKMTQIGLGIGSVNK